MPDVRTGGSENELQSLGIGSEECAYRYPVRFLPVQNDCRRWRWRTWTCRRNPRARAFGGYYFELVRAADRIRVPVPDQIGRGKSPKADIHYRFHPLGRQHSRAARPSRCWEIVDLDHSTGGMASTGFTLMNPKYVTHLVLEDRLGLADYRIGSHPNRRRRCDHGLHWRETISPDWRLRRAVGGGRWLRSGSPAPTTPTCSPRRTRISWSRRSMTLTSSA